MATTFLLWLDRSGTVFLKFPHDALGQVHDRGLDLALKPVESQLSLDPIDEVLPVITGTAGLKLGCTAQMGGHVFDPALQSRWEDWCWSICDSWSCDISVRLFVLARTGPTGSTLLRAMVAVSRQSEICAFVRASAAVAGIFTAGIGEAGCAVGVSALNGWSLGSVRCGGLSKDVRVRTGVADGGIAVGSWG